MNKPDELEPAPGAERRKLQGTIWNTASEAELLDALEQAFDYRGDVTITLRDGSTLEGYVFDRRRGASLHDSVARLIVRNSGDKVAISFSEIAGLAFTGRDTAAGKSWEAWVAKYWQKKAAGERNIELKPESLEHD